MNNSVLTLLAMIMAFNSNAVSKTEFHDSERDSFFYQFNETLCSSTPQGWIIQYSVIPTEQEIESVNERLPVYVADNLQMVLVEYDKNKRIERFHYKFTVPVDTSSITQAALREKKEVMLLALKSNPRSVARINAGVVYLYIYHSMNNTDLYSIRIDKGDL